MPRKSKPISPEATSDESLSAPVSIPTTIVTEELPEVKKPVRKNKKEDALRTSDLRNLIDEIVVEKLLRLINIYIYIYI